MDLVEQYLRAVAALLPADQREDIVAELRDTILSMIEEREGKLGRTLTDEEVEAVLREIGHPLVVSARYRGGPQQLIGPALYPYWMFAVKVVIGIQAAIALVSAVVRTIRGEDFSHALGQSIANGIVGALTLIGFATVAAWLIERQKLDVGYLQRWRVKDLRPLEFASWTFADLRARAAQGSAAASRVRAPGPRSIPAAEHLGAIAFGTVFVFWWIGAIDFGMVGRSEDLRELGLDISAFAGVSWSDVRSLVFWPVLAYGLAVIVRAVLLLCYPRATWLAGLSNIAMGAALAAFCAWAYFASPFSPALQVDSVSGLVVRLKEAFRNSPPLELAPIVTVVLASAAFGGFCRVLRGLWELAAGSTQGWASAGSHPAG